MYLSESAYEDFQAKWSKVLRLESELAEAKRDYDAALVRVSDLQRIEQEIARVGKAA